MSKKIILQLTKPQLDALIDIIDEAKAMIGCGDDDNLRVKRLKLIDTMLKKNVKLNHKPHTQYTELAPTPARILTI